MTGRFLVRYRIRQVLRAAENLLAPDLILPPGYKPPVLVDTADERRIIDGFHDLYYRAPHTFGDTHWLGVRALKCPLDLWIYQEILTEVRPDVIIEAGTAQGGTTLFLASVCDQLQQGQIVSIDIAEADRPPHRRITYLRGSSTDPAIIAQIRQRINSQDRVVVILDSEHTKTHVYNELQAYAPLVTPGSYLIVEDSNINGHPVLPGIGPGPMEAIEQFLGEHTEFIADRSREKFLLSFNPGGYLRKLPSEG